MFGCFGSAGTCVKSLLLSGLLFCILYFKFTLKMLIFCRMVLKSIGYKSVPVDGLPFDHQKGRQDAHIASRNYYLW